jgi:hypothetical protein
MAQLQNRYSIQEPCHEAMIEVKPCPRHCTVQPSYAAGGTGLPALHPPLLYSAACYAHNSCATACRAAAGKLFENIVPSVSLAQTLRCDRHTTGYGTITTEGSCARATEARLGSEA